jgi:hypothetical protein
MSIRGLAAAAIALALLLGLLALVAAHRLGYLAPAETPSWEYRNYLCDCAPGMQAVLRPGLANQQPRRYWFLRRVPEPAADDLTAADDEVGHYAHMRAAVEVFDPASEHWVFDGAKFFAYRQLGALTHTEFLEDIKLVEEDDGAGKTRTLLRVRFETPTRASSWYFYDPAGGTGASGLGWERVERHATGESSEVFYLTPDKFREPPPPR